MKLEKIDFEEAKKLVLEGEAHFLSFGSEKNYFLFKGDKMYIQREEAYILVNEQRDKQD